ncbi:MAG: ATP-binding protein [Planctomycetota bacterium]|jgi:two-component system sensor histidine kinase QseC
MKSIRQKLILLLITGLAVLFAAASAVLYLYARNAFINQFDEALEAKLTSFAGMSELENKFGSLVLELGCIDFPLPEFQPSPEAEYYQVWRADGPVMARSPSLNGEDLPRLEPGENKLVIQDIPLPDGRKGRAAAIRFTPSPEAEDEHEHDDEEESMDHDTGLSNLSLHMVMARSREGLDATLATLLVGYIITGLLLIIGVTLIVRASVGKGMRPLERIAQETAAIESNDLSHRFPLSELPAELVPISERLNELLERLESAFIRERRFNADIAHELRTPIAELRTLAEVALKKQSDPEYFEASQSYFQDALAISVQMEKLVTTLLALVRSKADRRTLEMESLDMSDLIENACRPLEPEMKKRGIAFETSLPDKAVIVSDKTLLSAILANLLSNAVGHTPDEGSIRCEVRTQEKGFLFRLENTNDQLTPDDLDRIFDPLWKKDASRCVMESNGLGLSLVSAYAGLLDLDLKAALPNPETFEITILFPAP